MTVKKVLTETLKDLERLEKLYCGFTILFFFLHRRSHRRADMTGYLYFYMANAASHVRLRSSADARTRMHDLWFTGLYAGHVKHGHCSRDAGASGKAKNKSLCLTPAPGGSDAKDALKHALEIERKEYQLACTCEACEAKVHLNF